MSPAITRALCRIRRTLQIFANVLKNIPDPFLRIAGRSFVKALLEQPNSVFAVIHTRLNITSRLADKCDYNIQSRSPSFSTALLRGKLFEDLACFVDFPQAGVHVFHELNISMASQLRIRKQSGHRRADGPARCVTDG